MRGSCFLYEGVEEYYSPVAFRFTNRKLEKTSIK